uniref:Arrestin C-terminal-like domain-containing protein n=1 Tax=Panagrolaimus sp. ES5 TaxID=591445 RepID=A0AC34F5Q6_9BILA
MVYNRNYLLPRQAPFSAMKPGLGVPLQSPFEAFIELDERIYNPGDVVTGKLHLELKKKLTCDVIKIQLFGSVRVFFIKSVSSKTPGVLARNQAYEQEIVLIDKDINVWEAPANGEPKPESSKTPGVLARNQAYEQEIVLIDKDINVWEAPANGEPKPEVTLEDIARMARSTSIRAHLPSPGRMPGFEPGGHDFTFSFVLPESGLQTSFDSKNSAGCIRYYILMQALNRGYTVFRKKHLFPIVTPVFLDADLRAVETPKTTSTQMIGKGSITATLELNKRGYVPGEPISGKITIQNNSRESIKNAFLRIVQTSTCCSKRPEMDIKVSTFESAGTGLPINKIVANSSYSYIIDYYVSALVPNFNIDACLSVSYKLVLSVGFARNNVKSSFMDLSIPIIIGTHPVTHGENVVPKYENLAPPAYYSNGYENIGFAPPSYEVSVSGRSEVNDEDDCDYSPLVYHYTFTNNSSSNNNTDARSKVE